MLTILASAVQCVRGNNKTSPLVVQTQSYWHVLCVCTCEFEPLHFSFLVLLVEHWYTFSVIHDTVISVKWKPYLCMVVHMH